VGWVLKRQQHANRWGRTAGNAAAQGWHRQQHALQAAAAAHNTPACPLLHLCVVWVLAAGCRARQLFLQRGTLACGSRGGGGRQEERDDEQAHEAPAHAHHGCVQRMGGKKQA